MMIIYSLILYLLFVFTIEGEREKGFILGKFDAELLGVYALPFMILTYVLLYRMEDRISRFWQYILNLVPALMLLLWGLFGIGGAFKSPELFVVSYLLSVILLIVTLPGVSKDDRSIVNRGYDVLMALLSTIFLVGVIWGLVVGISEALLYLFEFEAEESYKIYVYLFIPFVIAPLMYRYLEEVFFSLKREEAPVLNITFNYVLSPAVAIYTVIITLYLLKFFIFSIVPHGIFSYITISLFIVGLLVLSARYLLFEMTRFTDWLARNYKWAMIPTLALFAWAVYVRVAAYGWTVLRVYLAAIGVIMLMTTIALFFSPSRVFRVFLYSILIVIGGLSYNFVLSPKKLSLMSQENRMVSLARELGFLGGKDGKFLPVEEINKIEGLVDERVSEFREAYNYLSFQGDDLWLTETYGQLDIDNVKPRCQNSEPIHRIRLSVDDINHEYDVTRYRSVLRGALYFSDVSIPDVVQISFRNSILVRVPADLIINELFSTYSLDEANDSDISMTQGTYIFNFQNYDIFIDRVFFSFYEDKWHVDFLDVTMIGVLKEE